MISNILIAFGVYQVASWTLQALHAGRRSHPMLTETLTLCALVGMMGIFARWLGA